LNGQGESSIIADRALVHDGLLRNGGDPQELDVNSLAALTSRGTLIPVNIWKDVQIQLFGDKADTHRTLAIMHSYLTSVGRCLRRRRKTILIPRLG
jgi:hypothetical protein